MSVRILIGDVRTRLRELADGSVHCVVTSPPYFGLRDYGMAGQIGLEPTPDAFVAELVAVFREVRRVLREDGTLWLNLGDSYANDGKWGGSTGGKHVAALHGDTGAGRGKRSTGLKPKDLIGIPWRVAFALQADGWYLRQDIIWSKPNPMPESVTDRCTKAHEYLFLLSKSARYHYNADAIAEASVRAGDIPGGSVKVGLTPYAPGSSKQNLDRAAVKPVDDLRNKRSVWTVPSQPFSAARLPRGVNDGSGRTVSSDCPVHGDRLTEVSTEQRDAPPAASLSGRSRSNDSRPAQGLFDAPVPTETRHDVRSAPDSSDSLGLPCLPPATDHSNRSRRTARALETSPHVIGDAASQRHTGGNELRPEIDATSVRNPESKSGEDSAPCEPASDQEGRMASGSARKCTCVDNSTLTDHFAVFPPALIEPCILAGCPKGGTVLDPFGGAGTTGLVADRLQRDAILIELNPEYAAIARKRIDGDSPMFSNVTTEAA